MTLGRTRGVRCLYERTRATGRLEHVPLPSRVWVFETGVAHRLVPSTDGLDFMAPLAQLRHHIR